MRRCVSKLTVDTDIATYVHSQEPALAAAARSLARVVTNS
jgi:hypothetical protein